MPSSPAPLATLVSLALLAAPASAQIVFASDPTPRVTVTGSGAIEVQPDTAKVSPGVYVLERRRSLRHRDVCAGYDHRSE